VRTARHDRGSGSADRGRAVSEQSTEQHAPAQDPMLAGILAAQQLARALARHGIVLPRLMGDYAVGGTPMVSLGRCNAASAVSLAEVLEQAEPAR
jgi:hypothetical protein